VPGADKALNFKTGDLMLKAGGNEIEGRLLKALSDQLRGTPVPPVYSWFREVLGDNACAPGLLLGGLCSPELSQRACSTHG